MQIPRIPEGSGADAEVRFGKVAVQRLGSGRFRCRCGGQVLQDSDAEVRFRKIHSEET